MTSVRADAPTFTPIDLPEAGTPDAPEGGGWWIPGALWLHVVTLGLILLALVPILDNGAVVSADEGAVLSQVEILSTTGSWALPNPIPEVDPDGTWFGIDISDQHEDEFFPYAKHSAYPAAALPLYELGGQRLILVASALGTLVSAAFAALLARRLRRGLAVPTLWVVGVVSPLFFDSFWVIAHSIGAAFATGAVLAAVAAIEDRRARWLPFVALGIVGAVLFRSEGMLYGLALTGGATAVAAWKRDRLALAVAAVSAPVAMAAWWLDARIYSSIVGTTIAPFTIKAKSSSWIDGRLQGVWSSLLRPQLLASTTAGAIFLGIAVCGAVAALYVRTRPTETGLIRGAAVVAALAAIVARAVRVAPVPGLLIAFPLLPIGVLVLRREALATPAARLVAITSALFAAAIVGTQYPVGGSMEWGGRFFHLMLPALVPVLLLSLLEAGRRLDATTRRVAGGSMAVVSVVLLVFAVGSIVRIHAVTDDIVDGIVTLSESTTTASEPGGPVVVSNMEAVGRLSWRSSVHGRYLKVTESDDLPVVARRLSDAGIDEFVFAAAYREVQDRERLVGYEMVEGRTVRVGQWTLYVMRRAGVDG